MITEKQKESPSELHLRFRDKQPVVRTDALCITYTAYSKGLIHTRGHARSHAYCSHAHTRKLTHVRASRQNSRGERSYQQAVEPGPRVANHAKRIFTRPPALKCLRTPSLSRSGPPPRSFAQRIEWRSSAATRIWLATTNSASSSSNAASSDSRRPGTASSRSKRPRLRVALLGLRLRRVTPKRMRQGKGQEQGRRRRSGRSRRRWRLRRLRRRPSVGVGGLWTLGGGFLMPVARAANFSKGYLRPHDFV